jgi:RNA polymerase sigma-70 factor (ECF subfamily)
MEFFEIIDRAFDSGRAAWPGVPLAKTAFDERMRLLQVDPENLLARGGDLFLATACAAQLPAAVSQFERTFLAPVPRQLGRVALSAHEEDELRQQLRVKLLVGPTAKILEYKGSGPLGAWVRVCALRMALDLKMAPEVSKRGDNQALDALVAGTTPGETLIDSEEHREAFREALQESLAMLTTREKTLLRLHFLDGMNIDALGALFQVHRATVARWLVSIRSRVLDHVRQRLKLELGASHSEAQSLVRLLRSEVQVSIRRLLDEGEEKENE